MTRRDLGELARLAAELRADLAAAGELSRQLERWSRREASDPEVLIPAALLHHFYTAVEAFLARLAQTFDGSEPGGADGHRRLLATAALEVPGLRPAWITDRQHEPLRELLGFRHLFRHGYGARYRPPRLRELAALAVELWPGLEASLRATVELVGRLSQATD